MWAILKVGWLLVSVLWL